MKRIEYITAGESHGPGLTAIIKGLPAGFKIDIDALTLQLQRRKKGVGRGGRQKIESDELTFLSGLRNSITLGSPLTLHIQNKDFENWKDDMDPISTQSEKEAISVPRPGHADFAGMKKYRVKDIRNILERASARETAIRNAVGAICRQFLEDVGIIIRSQVISIGSISSNLPLPNEKDFRATINSNVNCLGPNHSKHMEDEILAAMKQGDSLGGTFRVLVYNLPVGLGSHTHWDEKLHSKISAEIMGINAIKGIEFGKGFASSQIPGSEYHDEFIISEGTISRKSNNAGGLEGGMTTGETLYFQAVMKPIPTLAKSLQSVNLLTNEPAPAFKERTDSCAVPAASIIAENITAIPILDSLLLKYGGDSWEEFLEHFNYRK